MLMIVQTFVVHLQSITASTKEMLEAVAEASGENPGADFNHTLPRTVVRLFQNSVILLTTASQAIRQLKDHFHLSNSTFDEEKLPNYNSLLSFLGVRAEVSMTAAMKDLILMVRTGETTESVNYAAIGPRYIAIVLYKNLLARKLMDNTGLVEFYKQRTLKLVRFWPALWNNVLIWVCYSNMMSTTSPHADASSETFNCSTKSYPRS